MRETIKYHVTGTGSELTSACNFCVIMEDLMVWAVRDKSDLPILKEIDSQTDRGAALIAAAYLEDRLVDAIKARTNRHEKIERDFYKGLGPLATFSAKINLGLLLGIYDLSFHRMLHTVRDIRNKFAHKTEPLDFNSQQIRDLCHNIGVDGFIRLDVGVTDGVKQILELKFDPGDTPRSTFINAVQFLLLGLDMELKAPGSRGPAAPALPELKEA